MDHALAVVAHHQGLAARKLGLEHGVQALERRALEVGARLAVGSHNLLRMGEDARLDGGGSGRILDQVTSVDATLAQGRAQPFAFGVGSDDP